MKTIDKIPVSNGVNFRFIKSEKFKTMRLSVTFFLPLNENTASQNALLSYVLKHSCKNFPDFTAMNKKLSNLYGASLFVDVEKIGECQAITISILGIDDRYSIDNSKISKELAEFLCNVIFNPSFDQHSMFNEQDLEQEKRQLIENIESDFNNKRLYAKQRCEQFMCQNEAFGVPKYGFKEKVKSLTHKDIYNAWNIFLQNSKIEIIMLGNSEPDFVYNIFKDKFSKIDRDNIINVSTNVIKSVEKIKNYNDEMDVSQCKLVMGFRAGTAVPEKEVFNTMLTTAILGGTPNSKLFINVREKLSLCYYCSARYNKNKGIILVESGVEKENVEKVQEEVLKQIEAIKAGDFSDFDIKSNKLILANSLKMISDSITDLGDWYISQAFNSEILSPEEVVDKILSVSKDDIISSSKNILLDTIYTLTGKDANN